MNQPNWNYLDFYHLGYQRNEWILVYYWWEGDNILYMQYNTYSQSDSHAYTSHNNHNAYLTHNHLVCFCLILLLPSSNVCSFPFLSPLHPSQWWPIFLFLQPISSCKFSQSPKGFATRITSPQSQSMAQMPIIIFACVVCPMVNHQQPSGGNGREGGRDPMEVKKCFCLRIFEEFSALKRKPNILYICIEYNNKVWLGYSLGC